MCDNGSLRGKKDHDGHCDADCVGARSGLDLRASHGLTPIEDMALDLVRLLLSAQVTGEARYWFAAMDHAETNLGSLPAATLCVHVTALVRAVRRDRRAPFSFLSFGCRHICDDEIAVISLLQALQLGSQADVDDALAHLAQGGPVQGLSACSTVLAERMRVIEAALVQGQPKRRVYAADSGRALH